MKQILQITKANAINAFNKTDEKGKKLLKNLFGENTFKFSYEEVKSYEDACAILDEEPVDFEKMNGLLVENDFDPLPVHEIAYKKLVTIAKALNIGWCPNWADFDEYKYYPWFDLGKEDTPAGVGGAHVRRYLALDRGLRGCPCFRKSRNRNLFRQSVCRNLAGLSLSHKIK